MNIFSLLSSIGSTFLQYYINQKTADRDRAQNYMYGEMSAGEADKRTRALYQDLYSPSAQLQQIEEAGLSPSVFYQGAGGISGQAGAQGTGAAGPTQQPTDFTKMIPNPTEMSTIALQESQVRLNNAEADRLEAKNPSGVAEVKLKLAQAGAASAEQSLKEAETFMQNLENMRETETYNAKVRKIFSEADEAAWNAKKAYFAAENEGLTYDFNEETYNARAQQEVNKANLLFWQAQVEEKKLELTDAQVENLKALTSKYANEVQQRWKELNLQNKSIENQKDFWDSEAKVMFKRAENEINRTYFEYTQKSREEVNRHAEAQDRLELDEYKAIIQAICIYAGLDAKSQMVETVSQSKRKK